MSTLIPREIYRAYFATEASARTPEILDLFINANSEEINFARDYHKKNLKQLQKRYGIFALCAGATITLAVALPSIPTITLGVVAGFAILFFGLKIIAAQRIIELCADEGKMKDLIKRVVNRATSEIDINARVKKEVNKLVFRNTPFA